MKCGISVENWEFGNSVQLLEWCLRCIKEYWFYDHTLVQLLSSLSVLWNLIRCYSGDYQVSKVNSLFLFSETFSKVLQGNDRRRTVIEPSTLWIVVSVNRDIPGLICFGIYARQTLFIDAAARRRWWEYVFNGLISLGVTAIFWLPVYCHSRFQAPAAE